MRAEEEATNGVWEALAAPDCPCMHGCDRSETNECRGQRAKGKRNGIPTDLERNGILTDLERNGILTDLERNGILTDLGGVSLENETGYRLRGGVSLEKR